MIFGDNNFRATCSCGRCLGSESLRRQMEDSMTGKLVESVFLRDDGLENNNVLTESVESKDKNEICKFIALTIVESEVYETKYIIDFIISMFNGKCSIDDYFSIMDDVKSYIKEGDIEYLEDTIRNHFKNIRDSIKEEVRVEYKKRFL